jgi:hypothetical protein
MNVPLPSDVDQTANILETLLNLNYLIREDAADSEKVRLYSSLAQERLEAMVGLIRPVLWNDYKEVKTLAAGSPTPPLLPC